LLQTLKFDTKLPKSYFKTIIDNEIDVDTARKFNFNLKTRIEKITVEFGIFGLLIYSSLYTLEFFDIEKEMIKMSSKNNGTSDPLDFIAPIMVYYLNSVRQF
jgi:hypothetical protein